MLPASLQDYYYKIVIYFLLVIILLLPWAIYFLKKAEAKSATPPLVISEQMPTTNLQEAKGVSTESAQPKTASIAAQKVQKKVEGIKASASAIINKIKNTPTPITVDQKTHSLWSIRSVSSMKISKDRICNQPSEDFIRIWVEKANELGVNYVSLETPYENPPCADALSYTRTWVRIIREHGIKVWHRHMPLAFEGIYDVAKNNSSDYLNVISDYIRNNRDLFAAGDIFTPIPEPQNGGIQGVTHCVQDVCQFTSATHFNQWLRDAIDRANSAFSEIGLGGALKIGYYGFDGFVAWGDNNPDWDGILEQVTVDKMGNITIDHYPELVGDTMENDLNELQAKYPNTPIVIGEWGTVTGGDTQKQVRDTMSAAKRKNVIGFAYWHMGTGGNESLINDDFSNKEQFDDVQSFFR